MGERKATLSKPANIAGVQYAVGDEVSLTEKQYKYLVLQGSLSDEKTKEVAAPFPTATAPVKK